MSCNCDLEVMPPLSMILAYLRSERYDDALAIAEQMEKRWLTWADDFRVSVPISEQMRDLDGATKEPKCGTCGRVLAEGSTDG